MNIMGLGPRIVQQLWDQKLVHDVADLYRLQASDLTYLDGFQEKSINNLLNSIANSRHNSLERLLYGLGIRHVGAKAARLLAEHFQTMQNLMHASTDEILQINTMGEIIADSLQVYFANPKVQELLADLAQLQVNMKFITPTATTRKHPQTIFADRTVVITGTLQHYKRQELTELLTELGAHVTSSVSKKTDYLIVGENAGSKLTKAQQLQIKILNEAQLQAQLH